MSDKIKKVHDLGYEKGKEEGKAETNRSIAMKMIADGDSNSKITHLTNMTDKEINNLRNNGKQMI